MKKITIKLSVLLFLLATNISIAQEEQKEKVEHLDEIVLSDTKFELKKKYSGKIIYKITQKDIQQNTGKTVIDLLDNIAGIEINGNNNTAGSNIGLYIRGGRNRQVAVLIDGVLVSDPTGISSGYNLNLLNLSEIESIEVLKGSSSTLYGSGAATGVINIKLKKASKKPISFNYMASVGTNNSQQNQNRNLEELSQNISVRGTLNKFTYLTSFSLFKTDGMSSANDKDAMEPFETDAFLSKDGLLKLGLKASEKISFEFFGNYNQYNYDYDAGAYIDSDVNNAYEEQLRYGLKSNFNYNKGYLVATVSVSDLERGFDSYNSWSDTVDSYFYEGKSLFAELVNKYDFSKQVHLITGINYQNFKNNTKTPFGNIDSNLANYNTIDPFASIVFTSDFGLNINTGARLNNHSEYGNHLVYHINPSYNITYTDVNKFKILGSYSTAFIAPSTYQLFSQYGNLDLNPEENKTIEFGFDISHKKWLQASSVFFYREEENTIVFVTDPITYAGSYQNASENQNAKGIETTIRINPLNKMGLNFSYTYTNKSADLDYIPKHKLTASFEASPFKNTFVSVNFKNVGERTYFDQWGSFGVAGEDVIIDSYSLIDLNVNYKWEYLTIFTSLSNIFNEDFEDTLGYSTKGRNFRLGLKFNF